MTKLSEGKSSDCIKRGGKILSMIHEIICICKERCQKYIKQGDTNTIQRASPRPQVGSRSTAPGLERILVHTVLFMDFHE